MDTLRALEAGETTREFLMSYHGVCERTLKSRLADARRWKADEDAEAEAFRAIGNRSEIQWAEIVTKAEGNRPQYGLEADELVLDRIGLFRINDGRGHLKIQHAANGIPVDGTMKKPPAKFQPKRPRRKKTG